MVQLDAGDVGAAEDQRVQQDDVRHRHEGGESTTEFIGEGRAPGGDLEVGVQRVPGRGRGRRGGVVPGGLVGLGGSVCSGAGLRGDPGHVHSQVSKGVGVGEPTWQPGDEGVAQGDDSTHGCTGGSGRRRAPAWAGGGPGAVAVPWWCRRCQ